jgi:hypothetical protein
MWYAAQVIPQIDAEIAGKGHFWIDAEIAGKGHFWMETRYINIFGK